jgi:hypothetical protein
MLRLEAVEPDTLELLRGIQGDPFFSGLLLVGGTALALRPFIWDSARQRIVRAVAAAVSRTPNVEP